MNVLMPVPTGKEIEALTEVLNSHWWGPGKKAAELEERWAKFTGAKYAVSTNSCTAALDVAVRLLDLDKWHVYTVSPFTFVSSALAPLNAGYSVRFVDINPETLCTDEADIQVMYAGNISGKGKIYDMAHCGGYIHLGEISCWSFHAVKNLPSGDGGMITMNDPELYRRAKAIAWCGIDKSTYERNQSKYSWDYNITEPGLKAHMNDITASIALCHLDVLEQRNAYRKQLAEWYDLYLPEWIQRPYRSSTWHLYTIRIPHRDELYDFLAENGISCGVHYKPLTHYKIFGKQEPMPNAEQAFKEILSLPMHVNVTHEDVKNICALVCRFYLMKSSPVELSSQPLNSAKPLENLATTATLYHLTETWNSNNTLKSRRLEILSEEPLPSPQNAAETGPTSEPKTLDGSNMENQRSPSVSG